MQYECNVNPHDSRLEHLVTDWFFRRQWPRYAPALVSRGNYFSVVSDKASIKLCMICVIAAQFVGQFLMYLSETTGLFVVGATIFGFGVGGVVPMQGAIVGRTFGRSSFGSVLGIMRPAMFPIQILVFPLQVWFLMNLVAEIAFRVFRFILSRLFLFAFTSDLLRRYRKRIWRPIVG